MPVCGAVYAYVPTDSNFISYSSDEDEGVVIGFA